MRTRILILVTAVCVHPTASLEASSNSWKKEFTREACANGEVYRNRGVDPNISREEELKEEAREARAVGAVALPKGFPGLFFAEPDRTYYAHPKAQVKLLRAAMRAYKRGYGLQLTSAFRTRRGAIDVACEYTDAAGDPDNSDSNHRKGHAFDLFLADRNGTPLWSRNGQPMTEAQMHASGWYVAILADILYGDRSHEESLYRLVHEIWHFEDEPSSCVNNICLSHPGTPGCTCNAEGT